MYHVTLVEATKGARMSKLDELDVFIAALERRRDAVSEQIKSLRAALEKNEAALKSIEGIYERVVELRQNIPEDMLHILDTATLGKMTSDLDALGAPQPRSEAISPAQVVSHVREALLAAGRPMKRGALVKELENRGVPLVGKDKNKNLGTILWRHPDQFVSLDGLGYWVKDVPLEGVYTPPE